MNVADIRLVKARVSALIATALCVLLSSASAHATPVVNPVPTLAYYYIWFSPSAWNRAKTDFPLLGRYSSDERRIMGQHVSWAKQAGIQGFIVSWKSTPVLDDRLEKLRAIAAQRDFKLAVIYQGLDFERRPLPVSRVVHDFEALLARYGDDPVFSTADGKPLIIWSGTWQFSRAAVARVLERVQGHALVLASEKDVDSYERLADLVDGNAYYWSSVDPETYERFGEKLKEMGRAVHENDGIWIAPAAPGFDARLVGGTSIVPRRDGSTLRRELDAAFASSPDYVGLISWNEFSENTHIEPSERFGTRYLNVVSDTLGAPGPIVAEFDSDAPAATGTTHGLPLLLGIAVLLVSGFYVGAKRRSSSNGQNGDDDRASGAHLRVSEDSREP